MLGVFDSGFGGLTVLTAIHQRLPGLSTVYLGDNARAPYGVRSPDEIFAYTLEGVRFLFDQGCPLVILACNTASAQALCRIQNEVLPTEFPDRRVLGVIRPAAEAFSELSGTLGIFATPATVASGAYQAELAHLNPDLRVEHISCPGLTDLIEAGRHTGDNCRELVNHFVGDLLERTGGIDSALLGCTHYPLVYDLFRSALPDQTQLFGQGEIVANALADYLERHPEMLEGIDQSQNRQYFTTGSNVSDLASLFYGEDVLFSTTTIN